MATDIKVKRGYDLKLVGEADKKKVPTSSPRAFAVKPPNFHAVIPQLLYKKPGAHLKAGEELFFSKYNEKVRFTTPVSGTIQEIVRGERRRVMEIVIAPDAEIEFKDFGKLAVDSADAEALKARIFESGCGTFIRQRPYNVVANPEDVPRDIYISGCSTAPLAADPEFILEDQQEEFQAGVSALAKLTTGKVYLGLRKGSSSFLRSVRDVHLVEVEGKHPAGNVGVQIAKTKPINKGERVWTVGPEDVAIIGRLLLTGRFDARRTVAVVGSDAQTRQYFKTRVGVSVDALVGKVDTSKTRLISGDVLTGEKLAANGYMGWFDNTLSLIPEGNQYRMFGWLPFRHNGIPSKSHTSFSWLFSGKKYKVNTSLNGEERAMVMTGEMEEVMPLDIYPMQLLKACLAGDIEKMEQLGIYEVVPEDFALVDFVNSSKVEAQDIIQMGLNIMITEVG